MKFGTQSKWNMLIMNILIRTDALDPTLKICKIWTQKWNAFEFLWNLSLEQSNIQTKNIVLGTDYLDAQL